MKEPPALTAAVLVIGDEILSGRTKDINVAAIAGSWRFSASISRSALRARCPMVEIVAAVNALSNALRLCVHDWRHRPHP